MCQRQPFVRSVLCKMCAQIQHVRTNWIPFIALSHTKELIKMAQLLGTKSLINKEQEMPSLSVWICLIHRNEFKTFAIKRRENGIIKIKFAIYRIVWLNSWASLDIIFIFFEFRYFRYSFSYRIQSLQFVSKTINKLWWRLTWLHSTLMIWVHIFASDSIFTTWN